MKTVMEVQVTKNAVNSLTEQLSAFRPNPCSAQLGACNVGNRILAAYKAREWRHRYVPNPRSSAVLKAMDICLVLPLSVARPTTQGRELVSWWCRTVCTATCLVKQLTRNNSLFPTTTTETFRTLYWNEMGRACSTLRERSTKKTKVENPEWRLFGRSRRRWEDDIKMYGCGMGKYRSEQGSVASSCEYVNDVMKIHPNQQTRQPPTQSEKYQYRIDTVSSPDDGHIVARNMYRSWNEYTKK